MNRAVGEAAPDFPEKGPGARAALIELAVFLALVLSYIWIWADAVRGGWIWIGVLGLGFTFGAHLVHGETPRALGFRLDTIGKAARGAAVWVAPVVLLLFGMGAASGRLGGEFLSPGRWLHLIGWALLQQYLLQSFIHRRIACLVTAPRARELWVAVIFAAMHLPNPALVAISFLAGWLFAYLFRRAPNIYVLALCHAVGSSAIFFGLDPETLSRMRVGPGFYRT